jgi:hypothetical protein
MATLAAIPVAIVITILLAIHPDTLAAILAIFFMIIFLAVLIATVTGARREPRQ